MNLLSVILLAQASTPVPSWILPLVGGSLFTLAMSVATASLNRNLKAIDTRQDDCEERDTAQTKEIVTLRAEIAELRSEEKLLRQEIAHIRERLTISESIERMVAAVERLATRP